MSTTPLPKNCQKIYFDKEVLYDKDLEPQIVEDSFCSQLCHSKVQCVYLFSCKANENCLFLTYSIAMCEV